MAAAHDNAKDNSDRSVKMAVLAERLMSPIVRAAGMVVQQILKRNNQDASILSSAKMTCLHVAAREGQRELCILLLDAGASLHMVDEKGNTPLHYAILGNQPKIADLLLSRGAAVDAVNSEGISALHEAASYGYRELCTLLLVAGASLDLVDKLEKTPLHYAAFNNKQQIIELLLSRGAAINVLDYAGDSALHVAARRSLPEICTLLLNAGASLHLVDKNGNTPLHCAVYGNNQQIIKLLLSRGACINAVNSRKRTVLHEAACNCSREICTLLLDADASIHDVDEDGDTPLYHAAICDRLDITDLLLSRGAAIDAVNNNKECVLHLAAGYDHHLEVCTLLLNAGASVHVVGKNGNTPLHYAVIGNAPEMADLLLSRGAAINSINNDRCSALHVAVCKQYVKCVRVLLRYHCDVNLQNLDGSTALHNLFDSMSTRKVKLNIIDALCSSGRVDFTLRNEFGCNILHVAALKGNADAMERLVTHAHHLVDVQMEDGNAALHLAALKGHREVAAILLSQNGGRAKVDLRNNLGQTPLHLATLEGHLSLVELLVHHNADIGKIDVNGDTVLHIACCFANNHKIVSIPESIQDSPLIYAICQKLARQGAQTELVLACFLISADRSCKLLTQVKNNKYKTPFDLLEDKQQAALFAYFLEFCKCQFHNTQLETENNPSTSYVEPPPYRTDNISQSEELPTKKRKVVSGDTSDAAEYRDYSGIIADTQQENQIDPSSSTTLVDCDHIVVKTQVIQDGQLETGEVSKANPDKSKDVSSEDKQKKKVIRKKEKDKDLEPLPLQMFRYLQTKITKIDKMNTNLCNICEERRCNIAFLCGHCACKECAAQLKTCHMCRKKIKKEITLYYNEQE